MNKFKAEFDSWMGRMFGPQGPAVDLRKNTQAMFATLVSKFDLITREEFEVQTRMLAEAVKKLNGLEKKINPQKSAGQKPKAKAKAKPKPKGAAKAKSTAKSKSAKPAASDTPPADDTAHN